MKRPCAPVAMLFIAGIVLGEICGLPFWIVTTGGLICAVASLLWPAMRQWCLATAITIAGAAAISFDHQVVPADDLRRTIGSQPRLVTVRGTLTETPYHRFNPKSDKARTLAKIKCEWLKDGPHWQRVTGKVAVSSAGIVPGDMWYGQPIEITGAIAPPEEPIAPGLFNYRSYLRRLNIHYVLKVSSPDDWKVQDTNLKPPITARFNRWAKKTLAIGLQEDEPLRLLWAMTLGWKTALSGEVSEPFMRSGTLHVFAISGLHVALIATIIAGLLRLFRVPRRYCGLIVIAAVWFYTAATGWQSSAVRSAVMSTVFLGSWVLDRPPDVLNSLSMAALVILVFDAQQLFQAGFQLSFGVVLSLALFGARVADWHRKIAEGDPLLPWELRPWWQQAGISASFWIVGLGVTSVAAFFGSIPLIAHYFHLITPASLFANLIVVPLSGFALASNLLSLLVGAWWTWGAEVFNHAAWFFMWAMVDISERVARWPGAAFHIAPFGAFTVLFYYGLLITFVLRLLSSSQYRPWTAIALTILGALCIVEIMQRTSSHRLTVMPLANGHSIYVNRPGSTRDLLVDCGNEYNADFLLKPFLQGQGVDQIANVILTHGDVDHVGGASVIRDYFELRKVWVPGVPFRSSVYRQVTRSFSNDFAKPVEVSAGATIAGWSVLYPGAEDKFPMADDKVLVLKGSIRGTRVLLMPDLSQTAQRTLFDRGLDLRSEIVITSISNDGDALADPLLDAIQPRLIIVADSAYPPRARARPALRERFARRAAQVIYTSESGAVTVDFENSALQVSHWRTR